MSHRTASGTTARKQVILTVNDSPAALYLTNKILTNAGFEVLEATDGTTALAMARQALPEVILLDIRLPDIDGLEIARRLRAEESTKSIPIIHTSATFVTSDKKAEGLDAGGDAYLTQPFESIELVALVRALLRMRAFENEARERADALLVADRRKNEFLAMLARRPPTLGAGPKAPKAGGRAAPSRHARRFSLHNASYAKFEQGRDIGKIGSPGDGGDSRCARRTTLPVRHLHATRTAHEVRAQDNATRPPPPRHAVPTRDASWQSRCAVRRQRMVVA